MRRGRTDDGRLPRVPDHLAAHSYSTAIDQTLSTPTTANIPSLDQTSSTPTTANIPSLVSAQGGDTKAPEVPIEPSGNIKITPHPHPKTQKPGMAFRNYSVTYTDHFSESGNLPSLPFILDSGSAVSLIDKYTFQRWFGKTPVHNILDASLSVSGVGTSSGHPTKEFAIITLRIHTKDGRWVEIEGEVHIVPYLSCNILVGNNILHPYRAKINIGGQVVALGAERFQIPVRVTKETSTCPFPAPIPTVKRSAPKMKKVRVFATDSTVLEPGTGKNVDISHKPLPRNRHYLFVPIPKLDESIGVFASAPKAIVNDDPGALPVTNFGSCPIKIHKGR